MSNPSAQPKNEAVTIPELAERCSEATRQLLTRSLAIQGALDGATQQQGLRSGAGGGLRETLDETLGNLAQANAILAGVADDLGV